MRITLQVIVIGLFALGTSLLADDQDERQIPVTGHMGTTGTVIFIEDFPATGLVPRNVEIWLPPSYESEPEKRYPVLYMHDGQNVFNPVHSNSGVDWGVDEAMTRLIAEGKVREAIVVGNWSIRNRGIEYMPQKAIRGEGGEVYTKEHPTLTRDNVVSDTYLAFIVRELKPWVDQQYRTLTGKEDTFVMGSSMGGVMSAYAISEYPDVFAAAACLSTHLPLGYGAIVEFLGHNLPDPASHRFYWDYGTESIDRDYEGYQMALNEIGYARGYKEGENWVTRKFEGHDHTERAWRSRVHIPLTFLLGTDASKLG